MFVAQNDFLLPLLGMRTAWPRQVPAGSCRFGVKVRPVNKLLVLLETFLYASIDVHILEVACQIHS